MVVGDLNAKVPDLLQRKWENDHGITENQIDHVAIIKTKRSLLQDTRVNCSADAGLDHRLVVAEIKMKLLALKKERSTRAKYQKVGDEFAITLAKRYDAPCTMNQMMKGRQGLTWNRNGARPSVRKSSVRSKEKERSG